MGQNLVQPVSARRARGILAASMFVMGACGIIYEYVLGVLGNYLIGSSHEEIFIIIGLMMFAMGVGSYLQRDFEGNLLDKFLALEIALGLVGGFSASLVYALYAISESYQVVLYMLAFAVGLLIGMEIPILIRINRAYARSLRVNLSEILSMDYVGSLAGALLFAYVLLAHVSLPRIGYILGFANVAVALVGFLIFRAHFSRPRFLLGLILFALAALSYGAGRSSEWQLWAGQRLFVHPVVYRETTPYQEIVITERDSVVSLYLNTHLQFSSQDEHIYHELLVHPALGIASHPRRVLILGGGDGLAVRECLKYGDIESITLVDIDPRVVELATTDPRLVRINGGSLSDARVHGELPEGVSVTGETWQPEFLSQRPSRRIAGDTGKMAEVQVFTVDADQFLRRVQDHTYDIAILDFPDPSRIEIAKLYSVEFYRQLRSCLTPQALVAVQSTSPYYAKKVFLCIGETLRAAGFSVVPYHDNVPSFGEWGFHLATPRLDQADRLLKALRNRVPLAVPTRYLTAELLAGSTYFGRGALEATPAVAPNTRFEPVLIRYFKDAWKLY